MRYFSRTFFALILALSVFSSELRAYLKIKEVVTQYGFKALLYEYPGSLVARIDLVFDKAGSNQDPPDKPGLALFAALALNELEVDKKSNSDFLESVEGLGASINFEVNDDCFIVHFTSLSENLTAAFELMTKLLLQSNLSEAGFNRAKLKFLSHLTQRKDSAAFIADREFFSLLLPKYQGSALLNEEAINKITKDDVMSYFKRSFHRLFITISAVGNVSEDKLGDLLDRYLIDLPLSVDSPLKEEVVANYNLGKARYIYLDRPQSMIIIGAPGVAYNSSSYYIAEVFNQILGGSGMGSILMQEIRKKQGLTYSIRSNFSYSTQGANIWQIESLTEEGSATQLILSVKRILEEVKRDGISKEELEQAKSQVKSRFQLSLENYFNILSILNDSQRFGLGSNYINNYSNRIEEVKASEVNNFIKIFVQPNNMNIVEVGKVNHL